MGCAVSKKASPEEAHSTKDAHGSTTLAEKLSAGAAPHVTQLDSTESTIPAVTDHTLLSTSQSKRCTGAEKRAWPGPITSGKELGADECSVLNRPDSGTDASATTQQAVSSCCGRDSLANSSDRVIEDAAAAEPSSAALEQGFVEYRGAPMPLNEEARHQTLCGLGALDTTDTPEDRFDDITRLLCQVFHVPVAIVTLVDTGRQWFKSVQGLPVRSTDRRSSFCAWTLLPQHPTVLVVPNALEDARFAENPLVQHEPFIRFYAGAPLVTSTGHRLGSLCIIDRKPRELEAESCNVLINFAEIVVREIEKEKMRALETARIKSHTSGLLRAFDAFKEGIMVCSSRTPQLEILYFNTAWAKLTGIAKNAIGSPVWDLFQLSEDKEKLLTRSQHAIEVQRTFSVELLRDLTDGNTLRFRASFKPANSERLDEYTPAVAIPGLMASLKDDGVADDLYLCTMKERNRMSIESASPHSREAFRDEPSTAPDHPFEDVQLGPLLGQGSFGRVYRGIWKDMHVAVKIIQPFVQTRPPPTGSLSSPDRVAGNDKAASECLLTSQLSHPNIVATYKTARVPFVTEGTSCILFDTWMVLEYCDQGTLQYAIERGKFDEGFTTTGRRSPRPDIDALTRTAREIAAAMAYLHGRGILHGDLCGGNILLSAAPSDARGFVAKVADFGLARNLEAGEIMTQTYGTVTHMPPELLTAGHLSKAADSYAFGTLLWELFTGNRPWAGLLPMQVIYHVTIMGKSLRFPDSTPSGHRELGEACLSPDPAKRPTFDEILRRLDDL